MRDFCHSRLFAHILLRHMMAFLLLFALWFSSPFLFANNMGLLPEKNVEQVAKVEKDSLGRETPRSAWAGLMSAYSSGDLNLAAQYLDDKYLNRKGTQPQDVAARFKKALDMGARMLPNLQISDQAEGNSEDFLPAEVDKIGVIGINGQEVDVLMVRRSSKQGHQYWQIAEDTLKGLPEISNNQTQFVDSFKITALEQHKLGAHTLADVLGLLFVLAASIVVVYFWVWLWFWCSKWFYTQILKRDFRITPRVILPLTLIIVALLLSEIMLKAGVPVTLRTPVGRVKEAVAWAATTWLLLRILDTIFNRAESISLRKNRPEQVSILGLLRKLAKALLLVFAVIIVFGNLGFDLTTGIAALGVGGLALAFGAQKTIENLIGSVVVVADRPVHIGDYCKFGHYEGRVIDIGIRSTRVRTLNRTVVTIPNGEFSALQIENYAARDMFHFLHQLHIPRDTPLYNLHNLLKVLKDFLDKHPDVNQEWTQVRISELRQDCFVVEIRAYIITRDVVVFYDKQSQLILEVLQQVQDLGIQHALPAQQLHIMQPENTVPNQPDVVLKK